MSIFACLRRAMVYVFHATRCMTSVRPGGAKVPRLAATLASLLLIASSIGVNITRYPKVGHSIDPAFAGAAETPTVSPSASEASRVDKADANQLSAKPEFAAPTAHETQPRAVNNDSPTDHVAAVVPQPTTAQADGNVPIVDVRPMVSVGDAPSSGTEAPANQNGVQRLPTVANGNQFPPEPNSADVGESYPTTATP
jgi:hypothetical protein